MAAINKIRLTIPRQNLEEFSLFGLSPEAAWAWVQSLPVANSHTVADLLGRTLNELNHFPLDPETRFAIIEVLRPNIEVALANLAKKYLNQPLVMPEEPAHMAELAAQLYSAVATAYTIVAVETIQHPERVTQTNPARLTCEALLRGLIFSGQQILLTFQLYRPLDIHSWQFFHQLYALAEGQKLGEIHVDNVATGPSTVKAAYLQSLILSCCKPNKLRQTDQALVHDILGKWSELVSLENTQRDSSLFTVDLGSDQPPLYSSLASGSRNSNRRYINASKLVAYLQSLVTLAEKNEADNEISGGLAPHLLKHMADSLGKMSLRNYSRTPNNAPLWVCLGLSSVHYQVAGSKDFDYLVSGNKYAPFETPEGNGKPFAEAGKSGDVWQRANLENDYLGSEWLTGEEGAEHLERAIELDKTTRTSLLEEVEVQLPLDQRYPVFKVAMADASPGGYCLEWNEELPISVKTGDIVCLKEEQSQCWVVAVIRWLSRLESSRNLIGLELLSPKAEAYGALIHLKNGAKSAPMRVLLLPEIKLVGQPETLIAPRASFQERQRLTLVRREEVRTVQLQRRLTSTASFSQFEFEYIEELGDVLKQDPLSPLESPFDSLWSNI